MQQTPPEVITANIAFIVLWALIVAVTWLVGQHFERMRAFRERMIAQWKPALAIMLIFLTSNVLSGRSVFNIFGLGGIWNIIKVKTFAFVSNMDV